MLRIKLAHSQELGFDIDQMQLLLMPGHPELDLHPPYDLWPVKPAPLTIRPLGVCTCLYYLTNMLSRGINTNKSQLTSVQFRGPTNQMFTFSLLDPL